jgi:heme oxygenase
MTTLKELTQHNHSLAEEHSFTKLLLSGKMFPNIYATYLANQLLQYQVLEHCSADLLGYLPGLSRSELILQDLLELKQPVVLFDTTAQYCNHVKGLNPHKLWAHIYTKHMGDLYGGQLIKTKVPGAGSMYNFQNRQKLIHDLRSKLDVSMADEANSCFEFTLQLFDRIADEYNI